MLSKTFKGVCSIIGGLILHLMMGSLYVFSAINGYYTSYLKLHDSPNITISDVYFFIPVVIFLNNVIMAATGILNKYINTRMISLIGAVLMFSCQVLLYNTTKFYVVSIAMVIFGAGIGIAYLPVIQNSWKFFPTRQGTISGIILSGFGLSASIFATIADEVINPLRVKPNADGLFPKEVAERVESYMFIVIIIFAILSIIGVLLVFPYDDNNRSVQYQNEFLIKADEERSTVEKNEALHDALFSKTFLKINIMSFGSMFFSFMMTNTNRSFGNAKQLNQTILSYMSRTYSLINGGLRVFWGLFLDRFGFKCPYTCILLTQIAVSSSFYFAGQNDIIFFIENLFAAAVFSGHISMMPAQTSKVFGLKNSLMLIAVTGLFTGTAGLMGPIIAKIAIINYGIYGYLYTYLSSTVFSTFALIAFLFFEDKPFQYSSEKINKDGLLLVNQNAINETEGNLLSESRS